MPNSWILAILLTPAGACWLYHTLAESFAKAKNERDANLFSPCTRSSCWLDILSLSSFAVNTHFRVLVQSSHPFPLGKQKTWPTSFKGDLCSVVYPSSCWHDTVSLSFEDTEAALSRDIHQGPQLGKGSSTTSYCEKNNSSSTFCCVFQRWAPTSLRLCFIPWWSRKEHFKPSSASPSHYPTSCPVHKSVFAWTAGVDSSWFSFHGLLGWWQTMGWGSPCF